MTLPIYFALIAFLGAGAAWFWPHCAWPALRSAGAPKLAVGLALVLTIALIAVAIVRAASLLIGTQQRTTYWLLTLIGLVYLAVVGLGFPRYRLLIRVARWFPAARA